MNCNVTNRAGRNQAAGSQGRQAKRMYSKRLTLLRLVTKAAALVKTRRQEAPRSEPIDHQPAAHSQRCSDANRPNEDYEISQGGSEAGWA